MKRLFFIFLIAFPFLSFGQTKGLKLVETEKDYYQWITFLSEGDIDWLDIPIQGVEGVSYRVIVTTSEIYNQIYIETATFGTEGCCKKITDKRELPLKDVFKVFNLKGEITGIEFVEWIHSVSFIFKIGNEKFKVEDIHMDGPIITKI
ncbi:hypothetical protein ACFLSE_08410 [Bacteroidota bacterium]